MLKILKADYISDYRLKVEFSDGAAKMVDLSPHLNGLVFGQLRDHARFVQYAIVRGVIEWTGEIDFAPEFLYEIGESLPEETRTANRLQRFFDSHREINVSGFAERIGLNPQLLSNYIRGYKTPSAEREEMIFDGIRALGAEYASV